MKYGLLIKVSWLCKPFANGSSANIKLSKTQVYKIEPSGEFLDRPLEALLKTGLPLMISYKGSYSRENFWIR